MSPFRTSTDWSGFQSQAGRPNVGAKISSLASPAALETPVLTLRWWQRLRHKKPVLDSALREASGTSHDAHEPFMDQFKGGQPDG